MDRFQPVRSDTSSIPSDIAHQLALEFGLTITDVRADARDVATWHGPNDTDLLTSIETRRRLDAATATTYLRNLRSALAK